MKRVLGLAFLACTLFAAPVNRGLVQAVERSIDKAFERLYPGEPYLLLSYTQGVYLEGMGCVYTARLNLAEGPGVNPFRRELPTEVREALRQKKLDRLPGLRIAMKEMMKNAAMTMDPLPSNERIVLAVSLFHTKDEDTAGLPTQILMQATKSALVAGQAGAIQTQEF